MQIKIMNLAYKMEIETRQLPHREKKCSYTLLSQLFTGHGSGLEIYVDMEKISQLIFLQQSLLFFFFFLSTGFKSRDHPVTEQGLQNEGPDFPSLHTKGDQNLVPQYHSNYTE